MRLYRRRSWAFDGPPHRLNSNQLESIRLIPLKTMSQLPIIPRAEVRPAWLAQYSDEALEPTLPVATVAAPAAPAEDAVGKKAVESVLRGDLQEEKPKK